MNKNHKISIIIAITATILAVTVISLLGENMVVGSSTLSLGIKEIKSVPSGKIAIPLSDQQLTTLPSILNGIKEADKLFNSQPPVTCLDNCPLGGPSRTPESYMGPISSDEAKLALSSLGFDNILRPGDTTPLYHGTIVEYHGKYYSISLIGI
ncbi:MAG: hypothetical protein ACREBJ_00645 [Nitrosotalea sp.]